MSVCLCGREEDLASLAQLLWLHQLNAAYCECVCCWSGAAQALQCGRTRERTLCTTVHVCACMRTCGAMLRLIVSKAAAECVRLAVRDHYSPALALNTDQYQ